MLWMNCNQLGRTLVHLVICWLLLLLYNEFAIYYVTLLRCSWPEVTAPGQGHPLKAMILADTHLLGPYKGHPWDKLRREWQMERAFQTSLTLFDPQVGTSVDFLLVTIAGRE